MSPTDEEMVVLSAKRLGMICKSGVCGRSVGWGRFPGLGYLAGDELLELAGELFPLPRCGPESAVCGGSVLRGGGFEVDRGYTADDVQRTRLG